MIDVREMRGDDDRPIGRHVLRYTWISGPNDGYGFEHTLSDRLASDVSRTEMQRQIEFFLAQVDPTTGFID